MHGKQFSGEKSTKVDSGNEETDGRLWRGRRADIRSLKTNIVPEVSVVHPIVYDSYHLCELHLKNKLS